MGGLDIYEKDIENIADSQSILDRGKTYYRRGKVKSMRIEKDSITAKIKGNYGTYTIRINGNGKNDFDYSCTCPYERAGCKHIVAVLYQWRYEHQGEKKGSSGKHTHLDPANQSPPAVKWNLNLNDIVQQEKTENILQALELVENKQVILHQVSIDRIRAKVKDQGRQFQVLIQKSVSSWRSWSYFHQCECTHRNSARCQHVLAAYLQWLTITNPQAIPSHYKQDLLNIHQQERFHSLVSVLNQVPLEKKPALAKYKVLFAFSRHGDDLFLELKKAPLLKNGSLGVLSSLTEQILENSYSEFSEKKKKAATLFCSSWSDDKDYYSYQRNLKKRNFNQPLDSELLLSLRSLYLEDHEAFPQCWFPTDKIPLEIRFIDNEISCTLKFLMTIDGKEYLLDKNNAALMGGDSLWIYYKETGLSPTILCEIESANPSLLRRVFPFAGLEINNTILHEFIEQYYLPLSEAGTIVLPYKYQLQEQILAPIPRLYLKDYGISFSIELRFLYGQKEVLSSPKQDLIFRDENNILMKIKRNVTVEEEYFNFLLEKHLLRQEGMLFPSIKPYEWIADVSKELIAKGFEIYGQYELVNCRLVEEEPEMHLTISSGIDWFDLKMEVEIAGEQIPFDQLMLAFQNQERFVKLSDGRLGAIPQRWLSKLAGVIGFLERDAKTKKLKASPSQISIIESLLNIATTAKVDAKTKQFREKFAKFQGIEEKKLPQGLQHPLRPYQKAGYDWLYFLQEFSFGGCLADEMGLGKTVQVLSLLLHEKEQGNKIPSLVVVPTSLVFNWGEEVKKFTPSLQVYVHHGLERLNTVAKMKKQNPDIILTTYGTLRNDAELFKEEKFHYIILDESQQIKNPLTHAAKSVYGLKSSYKLALTGTPIENNAVELWSQFAFLNPGLLGKMEYFKNTFAAKIEQGKDKEKAEALKNMVHPFILLRKKEMVAPDLPAKQITTLYCEMEQSQQQVYDYWKEKFRQEITASIQEKGFNNSRMKIIQGLTMLRQICNHPRLINESFIGESGKFRLLVEQIKEVLQEGHKILLFSSFVKMLKVFREHFDAEKIKYAYLDGSTTNRKEVVEQFQNDPLIPVFLISLKAGGLGLNLTAADYVFMVDPWWNPAAEMQAIDRAHRIGQNKKVFVYKAITKNSIEEKIVELQESKLDLVKNVISVEESIFKKLNQEDIQKMFG